ncbi:GNAT family N-acetyltransferase [Sphingobium sp. SCG-1]|uniref:GNAT family N-acetyltransferase n=1 Tax=Sphingobium sp. SCG-1 TaxID=2072936 RepID=UPI000CD676FA|nr:GNAT family N-acetyltransferase [Sphingobium sp. SCG-1]AUW57189.1 GNAT family N-acetyltransferase [Sphingobium sp. SCG-1]
MFARTDRLLLRPGWMEDAPALAQAIGEESIVRNLARAPWPYGEADAGAFLAAARESHLPDFLIFSRTRGAPRLIGGCGISSTDDQAGLELGYWIARPYWGLGFATEAARAVMQIARATGMRGITARHFLDNPASGKVLQKVGFRHTGIIQPLTCPARGETAPAALYEMADELDMPRSDTAFELYGDEAQSMAA